MTRWCDTARCEAGRSDLYFVHAEVAATLAALFKHSSLRYLLVYVWKI